MPGCLVYISGWYYSVKNKTTKIKHLPVGQFIGLGNDGAARVVDVCGVGDRGARAGRPPVTRDERDDDLTSHGLRVIRVVPLKVQPLDCNRELPVRCQSPLGSTGRQLHTHGHPAPIRPGCSLPGHSRIAWHRHADNLVARQHNTGSMNTK